MALPDGSSRDAVSGSAPASADLVTRAETLISRHPGCFWFWHPDARIHTLDDVRLVVRHLREYGGHSAWLDARDLHQCLSRDSRKTS
jgi:hypothetical protein